MDRSGAIDDGIQGEWSHEFCNCYSPMETCCCACLGPCFLYGKTDSRLRDPVLRHGDYCNGGCALYAFASFLGLHWVPLMMKRTEIRDRFSIDGSCCADCWASLCCSCCVLAQNEKELDTRADVIETGISGYQHPPGMAYYPQQ